MNEKSQQSADRPSGKVDVPVELRSKSLPSVTDSATNDESADLPITRSQESKGMAELPLEISMHIHCYVREYIALADKKAGFVFAGSAALLAFLYQKGATLQLLVNPGSWRFVDFVGVSALLGVIMSCFFAISVVFPRLRGSQKGFIFWLSIGKYQNSEAYSTKAQSLSQSEMNRELTSHAYELSKVCVCKYQNIRRSMISGVIGAVLAIVYFTLLSISLGT